MPHVTDNQNSEKQNSKSSIEDALVVSEVRYRRLFESAKDGILILDAGTGMIVDVNPFLIELLGYSKENFIKKTIWEIGSFKDIIDNKDKFLELQQQKYVRYEDLPLETASGYKINVEFISNVYLVNNQKVIQCNIRDITKRKKTEAGLEKTRKELAEIKKNADEEIKFTENIINTVREPLLVLDDELRVIKASRSFYNFFKVNPENTIGRLIYELGNQQWNIPKLRELLEKILPQKTTFDNYEVEHNFSSIGRHIMLLNARQIKRGLGKEKIILLVFEDVTERRCVERSLSEKSRLTNEYLNILLDHAHAPIIIWDSSLVIKRFNHKFEKLSGYTKSEVQEKKIEMLFQKNEIDSTLRLIKNNIDDENSEVIEINILTKDKEIRTVLWNSANISDEEGQNTVATIAQDITSRKRTEEALRISETRYRHLFESAKDGILILDAETGRIVDVNPLVVELFGYSKELFIEKKIWEIGFFRDIASNKDKFIELQRKEYVRYDNLILESADGRKINIEFVSNLYLVNNQKVIQCNIRDNSSRKQAEEALLESEVKYRTLVTQSPDGIFIVDVFGTFLSVNKAMCDLLKYSEEEFLLAIKLWDIVPQKYLPIMKERFASLVKGKRIKKAFEYEVKGKDGIVHFIEDLSLPYYKDKKIIGLHGIARDITERKRAEKELIEAKDRAEESDRLKSAFLANMSHEIRTPMNGILGFAGLLKEPMLTGEEQQEYIDIIEKSGDRMLNIINDIINISGIESGQVEISVSNTNINKQVEDILKFFTPEAEKKKLHISYSKLPENEAIINTDGGKVYAVLTNLVKNAIKFTSSGSIKYGYKKKGEFFEFFVTDTGIGVSQKQKEIIFERFRQGSDSLTRNYEGAGLGLAISKAYVEMLGGEIWIESKKRKGSTFRFTIPCLDKSEEKEQLSAITEEEINQTGKLKILVVEDDETSRTLLNIMIDPLSSDFFQATTGHEAIETCRNNPDIDLVLMDIQMQEIDGYEATRQIREFNKGVVIIAQTAYALPADREKAIEAGCNDYISKPINRAVLIKILEKNLRSKNV